MLNSHITSEAEDKACVQFTNCYFGFWGDPGGGRAGLKGMFNDLKSNNIEVIIKALTYISEGHLRIRGKPLVDDIKEAIEIIRSPTQKKKPETLCQYCRGFGTVDAMRNAITHQTVRNDTQDFSSITYLDPFAICHCIGGINPEYIWTPDKVMEFFKKQKQAQNKENEL